MAKSTTTTAKQPPKVDINKPPTSATSAPIESFPAASAVAAGKGALTNQVDKITKGSTDAEALAAKLATFREEVLQGKVPDLTKDGAGDLTVRNNPIPTEGPNFAFATPPSTIKDMLDSLGTMGFAEIGQLQARLYNAGYYRAAYYTNPNDNPLRVGDKRDQDTRVAFAKLLADAVTSDATIDDILSEKIDTTGRALVNMAGAAKHTRAGQAGGGNLYQTTLSSPAAIHELADQVAESLLGRKLTDDDKTRYAEVVRKAQGIQQDTTHKAQEANAKRNFDAATATADASVNAANAGGSGPDTYLSPDQVTTEQVDPQSLLTEQIRSDNKLEAGSHEIAGAYDLFSQIVGNR